MMSSLVHAAQRDLEARLDALRLKKERALRRNEPVESLEMRIRHEESVLLRLRRHADLPLPGSQP